MEKLELKTDFAVCSKLCDFRQNTMKDGQNTQQTISVLTHQPICFG